MFLWAKRLYDFMGKVWRRRWHPTPVLLPGKSHGRRSLVGCSPWGRGESNTTERLHFHFSLSCIGEGNGNPLQCSCLENPRDGGVCGVTQSRTRLQCLSSSLGKVKYLELWYWFLPSIPCPLPNPHSLWVQTAAGGDVLNEITFFILTKTMRVHS